MHMPSPEQLRSEFRPRPIQGGHLILLSCINYGSFGRIFTALGPRNPKDLKSSRRCEAPPLEQLTRIYAVKWIPRQKGMWNPRRPDEKEKACLEEVTGCSGVVSLYHTVHEDDGVYLVMDFYHEGDLQKYICKYGSLHTGLIRQAPEETFMKQDFVKNLFVQLLGSVKYCHDKGVFHQDIKPENILLDDFKRRLVLADFGLATRRARSSDFKIGSTFYMSPECLAELHCTQPYSSSANDVWALGMVFFFIIFGYLPWNLASATCGSFESFLLDPDFFLRRYPLSLQLHHLLMKVFSIDPEKRLSVEDFQEAVLTLPQDYVVSEAEAAPIRSQHLRPLSIELQRERIRSFSKVLDTEKFLLNRALHESQEGLCINPWSMPSDDLDNPAMSSSNPLLRELDRTRKYELGLVSVPIVENMSTLSSGSTSSATSTLLDTPPPLSLGLQGGPSVDNTITEGIEALCITDPEAGGSIAVSSALGVIVVDPLKPVYDDALGRSSPPTELLDFMDGRFGVKGGAFQKAIHPRGAFNSVEDVFGVRGTSDRISRHGTAFHMV